MSTNEDFFFEQFMPDKPRNVQKAGWLSRIWRQLKRPIGVRPETTTGQSINYGERAIDKITEVSLNRYAFIAMGASAIGGMIPNVQPVSPDTSKRRREQEAFITKTDVYIEQDPLAATFAAMMRAPEAVFPVNLVDYYFKPEDRADMEWLQSFDSPYKPPGTSEPLSYEILMKRLEGAKPPR